MIDSAEKSLMARLERHLALIDRTLKDKADVLTHEHVKRLIAARAKLVVAKARWVEFVKSRAS
jgi:hypothetical protein